MALLKLDLSEYTNGSEDEQTILDAIDFSDWNFYPEQDNELKTALATAVRREMADGLRTTLQEFPPDIEFAGAYVLVSINLGSNRNDGRIWFTTSITEMIDEYIKYTAPREMVDGDDLRVELLECLRACISKLQTAMEIENKEDVQEGDS